MSFKWHILADAAKSATRSYCLFDKQIDENKQQLKENVAKLKDAQGLALRQKFPQGTLTEAVTVKIGDDLDAMMGADPIEDGKIVAFRQ